MSVEDPKITDFEFIKTLGKGGFATVYMGKKSRFITFLVRKRTTGELYALKMVKKSTVQIDDVRFAQVLSERNILADMSHNFIV